MDKFTIYEVQGWQVFAGWWKNRFFHGKNGVAKIAFASKNPAKIDFVT